MKISAFKNLFTKPCYFLFSTVTSHQPRCCRLPFCHTGFAFCFISSKMYTSDHKSECYFFSATHKTSFVGSVYSTVFGSLKCVNDTSHNFTNRIHTCLCFHEWFSIWKNNNFIDRKLTERIK